MPHLRGQSYLIKGEGISLNARNISEIIIFSCFTRFLILKVVFYFIFISSELGISEQLCVHIYFFLSRNTVSHLQLVVRKAVMFKLHNT